MADEGFHEIELRGKQLVFLFMAATVVSVVIFLCGVMVGRNLRLPQPEPDVASVPGDPTIVASGLPSAADSGAPVSAQETLTYAERLEAPTPVAETLREPARPSEISEPQSEPVAAAAPPAVPAAAPPAVPAARSTEPALAEPAGNGWVVQVQAVNSRTDAEAIARRLAKKGYPTFVSERSAPGARYRIRVGKFSDRREADSVGARLKKEEQFNVWITR
jgi:cell division septation protein DedD